MNKYLSFFPFLVVTSISIFAGTDARAGQYVLYLNSEPGDYIGMGQELIYTDADLTFSANLNFDNGVSLSMINFDNEPFTWWYADFAAPYDAPLSVGAYENATRFPFQQDFEAGLSIYGDGRGCNTLTGRFDVLELTLGGFGEVVAFAVDFEQHCEGADPALFGSIRFNSDVPVPTLFPGSISVQNPLNNGSCVEAEGPDGARIYVFGSSPQDTGQITYAWEISSGETGLGQSFDFVLGVDQSAIVELTITDTLTGESAISSTEVCVSDTLPPTIVILNPTEGSKINAKNWVLEVQINDLVDQDIQTYELFTGQTQTVMLTDGYSEYRSAIPDGDEYPTRVRVRATDSSGNIATSIVNVIASRGAR